MTVDSSHKESSPRDKPAARAPSPEMVDYCGMPLEEWKNALVKDVAEHFGPTPDDLQPIGGSGW